MEKNKNKFISDFIDIYSKLPEVWDKKCPQYSNRNLKNEAYTKLIEKLKEKDKNANRETVVKKINSLRTNFRKEIKKSEGNPNYSPSLWYFDKLAFLENHDILTSSKKNTMKAKKEQHQQDTTNIPTSSKKNEKMKIVKKEPQTPIIKEHSKKRDKKYVPLTPEIVEENSSSTVDMRDIFSQISNVTVKDEFQITTSSYAEKLKKMDNIQCLFADRLIHEVLMEGQLGNLMKTSRIQL